MKEAGAIPLEGVGKKHVFGKPCVSIKFDGYSNSYEKGYYNGAITFYVIPDDGYRLHAVHTDNGKGLA